MSASDDDPVDGFELLSTDDKLSYTRAYIKDHMPVMFTLDGVVLAGSHNDGTEGANEKPHPIVEAIRQAILAHVDTISKMPDGDKGRLTQCSAGHVLRAWLLQHRLDSPSHRGRFAVPC